MQRGTRRFIANDRITRRSVRLHFRGNPRPLKIDDIRRIRSHRSIVLVFACCCCSRLGCSVGPIFIGIERRGRSREARNRSLKRADYSRLARNWAILLARVRLPGGKKRSTAAEEHGGRRQRREKTKKKRRGRTRRRRRSEKKKKKKTCGERGVTIVHVGH